MQLSSDTARKLLRAALIAVDDQLGDGAARKNPALVGAVAQALAARQVADTIAELKDAAKDALVQIEAIADGVRGIS